MIEKWWLVSLFYVPFNTIRSAVLRLLYSFSWLSAIRVDSCGAAVLVLYAVYLDVVKNIYSSIVCSRTMVICWTYNRDYSSDTYCLRNTSYNFLYIWCMLNDKTFFLSIWIFPTNYLEDKNRLHFSLNVFSTDTNIVELLCCICSVF